MSRWLAQAHHIPLLGRYGDTVNFAGLNPETLSPAIAEHFSAVATPASGKGERCGSPGEVGGDPTKGHLSSFRYLFRETDTNVLDDTQTAHHQRQRIVNTISLTAPDQLRQRMAWALSQILVINEEASPTGLTEAFLRYYDILVRNAFGT